MTLQRRSQIAELTRREGPMRVQDLAQRFGVSLVTIRNDLAQLEREGQLIRDRGGALPPAAIEDNGQTISSLLEFEARAQLNIEPKQRIGQAAARLVRPGDTILLDAGTTVVEMSRHLSNVEALTVVTNALNVAYHVGTTTEAQLVVLGGTFNREAASTLGPLAEAALRELLVNQLFLGAQAIDIEHGITDTTMEIASIKRAMLRSAHRVILMADSSKFGKSGFIKVAPLTEVQTVITDTNLDPAICADIERLGIEVILV